MSNSTIAAIATAPGRGGVAIIRVSGPDAFAVAERLTGWRIVDAASCRVKLCKICYCRKVGDNPLGRARSPSAPQSSFGIILPSHDCGPPGGRPLPLGDDIPKLATLPKIYEGARRETRDECLVRAADVRQETKNSAVDLDLEPRPSSLIDTALVLAFGAPHSYTGEDVVEFQCHGGTVTPARVLAATYAAGATAARQGEFTERAFMNGKLDLSQAESVIELVDAKTARAADDALARQAGVRKTAYRALYEKALALSAELEHALDVDEEELPADFLSARAARLAALGEEARRLAGSADAGRLLREGALVVLAGAPNAGKSSLLNALCGENRAIVSPTPGTTRDAIEAWIDLEGWPVRLVDTAGLRATGDEIEAEGVRRAEALIAKADVVLALDCEVPMAHFGEMRPRGSGDGVPAAAHFGEMRPQVLHIHAKCDLDTPDMRAHFSEMRDDPPWAHFSEMRDAPRGRISPKCALSVSAKTGEGLAALCAAIVACLTARAGDAAEDGATASERERALLLSAARLSSHALDPVLLANAARAAAETLGGLVGATYSADLLDSLFSRFCVGK